VEGGGAEHRNGASACLAGIHLKEAPLALGHHEAHNTRGPVDGRIGLLQPRLTQHQIVGRVQWQNPGAERHLVGADGQLQGCEHLGDRVLRCAIRQRCCTSKGSCGHLGLVNPCLTNKVALRARVQQDAHQASAKQAKQHQCRRWGVRRWSVRRQGLGSRPRDVYRLPVFP